jgi:prepilin-type N-terminal cleavage/methylation domain-containing protein/prepilin-type processing-associated H-X9-DG protein
MLAAGKKAFTLVELLVVIGIIALLISILLPALNRARAAANAIKCSANLRSVGQGFAMYLTNFKQVYPAAYLYNGPGPNGGTGQFVDLANGIESPTGPVDGYIQWSYFIYGYTASSFSAFTCPALNNGGLPKTDCPSHDPGTTNDPRWQGPDFDLQAPRMAYTVNEAICPRNKFVYNFDQQGGPGCFLYQFVRASQVRHGASVILATEFWDIPQAVTDSSDPPGVIKSHRPVHGFQGNGGVLDMGLAPVPTRGLPTLYNCIPSDLSPYPPNTTGTSATRLDWIGRNHGTGHAKSKVTNFLYVDGHVETKTVEQTLKPFQWGERFYSLTGGNNSYAYRP